MTPKLLHPAVSIRWLLMLAWFFSTLGLLFASLTFVTKDPPSGTAIMTFNTSTLGQTKMLNVSIPFEERMAVESLVRSFIRNHSITRELGAHDWYSISYLQTCSGSYSVREDGIFSRVQNATCTNNRWEGKAVSFILRQAVQQDLKEVVKGLADTVPNTKYRLRVWLGLWSAGLGCSAIVFLFLPWTFGRNKLLGTRHWCLIPTGFSLLSFALFIATLQDIIRQWWSSDDATMGRRFLAYSIAASVFMFMTFVAGSIAWSFGVWLGDNLPVDRLGKPKWQHHKNRELMPTEEMHTLDPIAFQQLEVLIVSRPSEVESSPAVSPSNTPMGLTRLRPLETTGSEFLDGQGTEAREAPGNRRWEKNAHSV